MNTRTKIAAITTAAAVAVAVPVAIGTAQNAGAEPPAGEVVQIPVTFSVENVNRSVVECGTDGQRYDVAATLTAPADALDDPGRAVTLYQHGIAGGEWYWNLPTEDPALEGYNHVVELAERGHVSVSFDRLGYDDSGLPPGVETCIGAQADVTNQIVDQLRSGEYTSDGARPAFEQVVLAGQSNGGLIANLAAISFDNVDGLSIHGWGDLGFTAEADERFIAATGRCLLQLAPDAEPGVGAGDATGAPADIPPGYTYYDNGTEEFLTGNFADAEQAVLDAVTPLQNAHPCGDMSTITLGIYEDLNRLDEVDVPVQVVHGEDDARIQGIDVQSSLYGGAEVDELVVPAAGHYMGLERNAALVHDDMAAWLTDNGLV